MQNNLYLFFSKNTNFKLGFVSCNLLNISLASLIGVKTSPFSFLFFSVNFKYLCKK
jgi:hypothetical protein